MGAGFALPCLPGSNCLCALENHLANPQNPCLKASIANTEQENKAIAAHASGIKPRPCPWEHHGIAGTYGRPSYAVKPEIYGKQDFKRPHEPPLASSSCPPPPQPFRHGLRLQTMQAGYHYAMLPYCTWHIEQDASIRLPRLDWGTCRCPDQGDSQPLRASLFVSVQTAGPS
ncbi:hypothetical protein NEUTE1DRAFT_101784 [Neurospora tetrasperma FGSC 2508]|uniref:Uncharacterized protein n=1 Tax=Neurospora tetrasperma (strain FGSC 2508 / ATCC MYA-4615 / P0657) TaxID=510951 RepID=F8MQ75_NEUT8|nr:uncharacterized protein NEUTE1DRAFT_101784 [Neurospora tetrasperma FGSC 2508]EGO56505.1 hypothetical protein NEUTE1DRAFT_101784 [Neurospora tetrasperma FGSC 2508]